VVYTQPYYASSYTSVNPSSSRGQLPARLPQVPFVVSSQTLHTVTNRVYQQQTKRKYPVSPQPKLPQPVTPPTSKPAPHKNRVETTESTGFSTMAVAVGSVVGAVLGAGGVWVSPLGSYIQSSTQQHSSQKQSTALTKSKANSLVQPPPIAPPSSPPPSPIGKITALGYVQPDPNNPRAFQHEATGIYYELSNQSNNVYEAHGQFAGYDFDYIQRMKRFNKNLEANAALVQQLQSIFNNSNLYQLKD
jgi:hypothetical protein